MAKKVNALKLVLESRGQAEVSCRMPAKISPALYLMQLRLPRLKIPPLKKKVPVIVDAETRAQIEHPVKIRHVA
jgi:hypothetical protein